VQKASPAYPRAVVNWATLGCAFNHGMAGQGLMIRSPPLRPGLVGLRRGTTSSLQATVRSSDRRRAFTKAVLPGITAGLCPSPLAHNRRRAFKPRHRPASHGGFLRAAAVPGATPMPPQSQRSGCVVRSRIPNPSSTP
jgi:hypothetical protein